MIPRIDPDYPISFVEACSNTFLPVRGKGKYNASFSYKRLNAYALPPVVPQKIAMLLTNIRSKPTLALKFRIIRDPAGKKGVLKSDLVRWFSDMRVVSNPQHNLMIQPPFRNNNLVLPPIRHKSKF